MMQRTIGHVVAILAATAALLLLSAGIAFADCTVTYQGGGAKPADNCGDTLPAIAAVSVGGVGLAMAALVSAFVKAGRLAGEFAAAPIHHLVFAGGLPVSTQAIPHTTPLPGMRIMPADVHITAVPPPIDIAAAATSALSETAINAIDDLTGSGFGEINGELRRGSVSAPMQSRVDAIVAALTTLPNHIGPVLRGTDLAPELLAQYQPGTVVTEDAFTHASLLAEKTQTVDTFFNIYSQTGKYVAPYSRVSHEQEVLFLPGTSFLVIAKTLDPVNGLTVIDMMEVLPR